jgi:hypothetical protein
MLAQCTSLPVEYWITLEPMQKSAQFIKASCLDWYISVEAGTN